MGIRRLLRHNLLFNIGEKIMSIIIDIESTELITRPKKAGGNYQVQEAFAHTTDRNGVPQRYPEKINLFPPRDHQNNSIPYNKGKYILAPQSLRVVNGFLELGFPALTPFTEKTK